MRKMSHLPTKNSLFYIFEGNRKLSCHDTWKRCWLIWTSIGVSAVKLKGKKRCISILDRIAEEKRNGWRKKRLIMMTSSPQPRGSG